MARIASHGMTRAEDDPVAVVAWGLASVMVRSADSLKKASTLLTWRVTVTDWPGRIDEKGWVNVVAPPMSGETLRLVVGLRISLPVFLNVYVMLASTGPPKSDETLVCGDTASLVTCRLGCKGPLIRM